MTSGDSPAWLVARSALDHHDTVAALDRAVSGQLGEALAEDVARGLTRLGLVLVPLNPGGPETVDEKLADEAAAGWFGREQDG